MNLYGIFDDIEKRNIENLFFEIQYIFKYEIGANNFFTMEMLEKIIKEKNIQFTKKDLYRVIYTLLIDFGSIVRYDYWNSNSKYQVLDERYINTNWQRSFYSLTDDNYEEKKFLLISDTHIGNSKINNFSLINNIYDFAIKNEIKNIFHLGDVFEGINCNDSKKDKLYKLEKQLSLFMNYYPILDPNEVKIIALLGNHDKTIYGTYRTNVLETFNNITPQLYDLRNITKDNPSFTFYARKMFSLKLNNIPIHFSHRLFVNPIYKDVKVKKLDDIIEKKGDVSCDFSLYFSGHLHQGLICTSKDFYNYNQLFVGVPSTSLVNIDNVVAYIVNIDYDNYSKYINITSLYSNINSQLSIGGTYTYKIDNNNIVKNKIKSY